MSRTEPQHSMVRVDTEAIRGAISKSRFSKSSLARKAGLSRDTIDVLVERGVVRDSTFAAVVEALGGEPDDYLADKNGAHGRPRSAFGLLPTEEWGVDDSIPSSKWVTAANGLQYCICRMRHLTISDDFGRGKYYDLRFVRKDLRDELKHHLERHAVVAKTVSASPYIPHHYSCVRAGTGEGWWVIDRWIDGKSLDEHVSSGPLPRKELPRLMKEILSGLAVLHSHNIVLRELNPACVLIPTDKRPAVIADLEMAKLFNGTPTVANKHWPPSPFRAPQVESGQVAPSVDLFSWAVVLLNAATGRVPDAKHISGLIPEAALPETVSEVVKKCLSSSQNNRPQDCRAVQKAIAKWR